MNSIYKWFILLDLRIALAVYIGFMQFFSISAIAQSNDPGSLQSQMAQRRMVRETEERRAGIRVAQQKEAEGKVKQRQAALNLQNGQQAVGTDVTVENGKAEYHIFFGSKDFDLMVKNANGKISTLPPDLSFKEILAHMDAIKSVYGAGSIANLADDQEWIDLSNTAQKYREYQEELKKFQSTPIQNKLLKFAKGVEYENLSVKQIEQERAQLASKNLPDVIHEANVRFPKDTFMFFFAIGAVIAAELVAKSGGDPLAMQKHFESLTDPIANLSFYSFILANGLSLHYLKLGASKQLIDFNHRLIFASLPMISMPFASFVSNVVSDTAMTVKACADEMLSPKANAEKKQKMKDRNKANGEDDEHVSDQPYTVCDEALRQWTFANKSNQYLPQLLSLSLSNAPFIALGYGTQAIGKKLQVYSFIGAETAFVKIGGRVVMTGLKFLLSPIPAIALDMMVTNPLTTRAWSTVSDDIRIDNAKERMFETANNCVWQLQASDTPPKTMPKSCQQIKEDALILRDRSQSWRATINSDFETGFASWTELMIKFNNQLSAAQWFYSYVFNHIWDYNFAKTKCESFKVEKDCERMTTIYKPQNFVLTKQYPFFAGKVNPKFFNSSEQGDSPEEYEVKLKNAYSAMPMSPLFLAAQATNIHEQVRKFLMNRSISLDYDVEKKIYDVLVTKLQSNKISVLAEGLQEFNVLYRKMLTSVPTKSTKNLLIELRKGLGDIRPIMNYGEGFLWARSLHSQFDDTRTTSEYGYHPGIYGGWKFPTTAHYFMHEMLCGKDKGELQYLIDFNGLVGEKKGRDIGKIGQVYAPPRLIKDPKKIAAFCFGNEIDYSLTFNNLDFGINDNGVKYNPTQYLVKEYNYEFFNAFNEYGELYGSTDNKGVFKAKEKETYFPKWWINANKGMLDKFLTEAREDWIQIYTELIMSFKNRGYVQDPTQRNTIIKQAKGMMSDNIVKLIVDHYSNRTGGLIPQYKAQPKNSLEVIVGETNIYIDLLKKLNYVDDTKKSWRSMEAIIDYVAAQNDTITYLQSIFELKDAHTDQQLADAMKLPDADVIAKQQENLKNALTQLKYFLISGVTEPLLKNLNTDLIYAIEASHADLNKYLMAATTIGIKDKEALRAMKEQSKNNKQLMQFLSTQGKGPRPSGR